MSDQCTTEQHFERGKSVTILITDPRECLMDATHADINIANFFKKLIIRCVPKTRQWDKTKEIKKKVEDAETQFNSYEKERVGSKTLLMMPGNYARMMFNKRNEKHLLNLASREYQTDPHEVKQYKSVAVEF